MSERFSGEAGLELEQLRRDALIVLEQMRRYALADRGFRGVLRRLLRRVGVR